MKGRKVQINFPEAYKARAKKGKYFGRMSKKEKAASVASLAFILTVLSASYFKPSFLVKSKAMNDSDSSASSTIVFSPDSSIADGEDNVTVNSNDNNNNNDDNNNDNSDGSISASRLANKNTPSNFGSKSDNSDSDKISMDEFFSNEHYKAMCFEFEDNSYSLTPTIRNMFYFLRGFSNENSRKSEDLAVKNDELTKESTDKNSSNSSDSSKSNDGKNNKTDKDGSKNGKDNSSSQGNEEENTNTYDPSQGLIKEEWVPENKEYEHYNGYLWVGDSRTYGMSGCVSISTICKSAMGLEWMKTQTKELYSYVNSNIIFNFGINDYWNLDGYINFYNNMPEEFFKNNKIFIMAVNPVDEVKQHNYGYNSSNETIKWFNDNLRANLRSDIVFIDSYDYLMKTGFNTADGIHYDYNTYIKIYNFIVETISYGNKTLPDNPNPVLPREAYTDEEWAEKERREQEEKGSQDDNNASLIGV